MMGVSRLMHVVMKLATPDVDKRFYHSPWGKFEIIHAACYFHNADNVSTCSWVNPQAMLQLYR